MKICLITKECYPFSYGGIGSAFYFLGVALARQGHEVVLLSRLPLNYDESVYGKYYGDGFRVEWVDFSDGAYSPHAVLDYSYQLAAHFERFDQAFNTNILIYPEFDGDAFFLVKEKYQHGKYKECAFAIHFSGPLSYIYAAEELVAGNFEKIIFRLEEYCIRASRVSIAPSLFIWQTLKNRYGLEGQLNLRLPNPVNRLFYSLPLEERPEAMPVKNIVFVGRLQKTKGVDHLLQAFGELVRSGNGEDIRLQLIGRDMYWNEYGMSFTEYWSQQLDEVTLSRVEFIGALSQPEMVDYLQKAWVAVFPSRFEVFGNVAFEAMCCGVPVLVNKMTGLAAVIGTEYGFDWDGEPGTLSLQLSSILQNADWQKELAGRSLHRAKELQTELEASLPGLLDKIIKGNRETDVPVVQEEESLFHLLNQFSAERLQMELKTAWQQSDQKDVQLAEVWKQHDDKDRQLLEVWKQHDDKDRQLAELWAKHDEKEVLLNELRVVSMDQEKRIRLLWKDLGHQLDMSRLLHEEIDLLQSRLNETNVEIDDLRAQPSSEQQGL